METVHTTERLAHLRELMKQHKVDIYGKKKTYKRSSRDLAAELLQSSRQKTAINPSI